MRRPCKRCIKGLLLCAVVVMAGIMSHAGWLWFAGLGRTQFIPSGIKTTKDAARIAGDMPMPKTARLLHSSRFSRPLWYGDMAVIDYGSPDIKPLISHLKRHHWAISRTDRPRTQLEDDTAPKWWDPDLCHKFITAKYSVNVNTEHFILIDLDDPVHPVLYIFWSMET